MNSYQIILSAILLVSTSFVTAQEWKLVNDKDDVLVYTRKVEGQAIKDVKINTTINTTMNELVAALEDFELQESWVKNTIESRKIEEVSPAHFFFYIGTNFPFPAKDRDAVMEYKRVQAADSKVITIDYEAFPDKIPENPDYVRIPALTASYTLTPLSNDSIAIEYYLRADIGGSIPSWIINMGINIGPRDTMKALKKILASGKYKNVKVEGVEEMD